jgi:hypothetical protein
MSSFRACRSLIRAFLLPVLISLCFGQEHSPPSRPEVHPDGGSISGNIYSNRFFDFTYEFPKDWIPHGEATNKRIMESARERVLSSQPGRETEVTVEAKHTYNLLTVFENELGKPGVRFFRSELVVAEDVSFAPGIKNGKDYFLDTLPTLKRQVYQTFSEIRPIELDGVTFYREDLTKRISQDITVHRTQLSTISTGMRS